MTSDDKIAAAQKRVAESKEVVERQRATIAEKKAAGLDTKVSELLLGTLEKATAVFEDELAALIKKSEKGPRQG